MNKKTFEIRQAQLLREISIHPHKDELLNIMYNQLQEDHAISDNFAKINPLI